MSLTPNNKVKNLKKEASEASDNQSCTTGAPLAVFYSNDVGPRQKKQQKKTTRFVLRDLTAIYLIFFYRSFEPEASEAYLRNFYVHLVRDGVVKDTL